MPGDSRIRPFLLAVIPAMLCSSVMARPALPQGFSGSLQIQYQRVEQDVLLIGSNGRMLRSTLAQSFWVQNYQLNHAKRFGDKLSLVSQLRLTDLSYVDRSQRSQTPYGVMRLTHPLFGITGSHQPRKTTTSLSVAGSGNSEATQEIETREQETSLFFYAAPPRLPRLDVTWVRRRNEATALSKTQTGETRNARLGYVVGPLNLRGGYSDIVREPDDGAARFTQQQTYNGGAALRLVPFARSSFNAAYDVADIRQGASLDNPARSRTHVATLRGQYLQTPKATWSAYYGFRRSELVSPADTVFDNHNGTMTYTYVPSRPWQLTATGGVRTQRTALGSQLQRYVSGIATASGHIRRGWQGIASASIVRNWDPTRSAYTVQTYRGGSILQLRRGLTADVSVQVSTNGDTIAPQSSSVTTSSARLRAVPLRTITVGFEMQAYRAGPDLWTNLSRSTSSRWDVNWTPWPQLRITGYLSRTGNLPDNSPQVGTRQLSIQWDPSRRLQLSGIYTESDQIRSTGSAEFLEGREILTLRLLSGLTPTLTFNAAFSAADPGEDTGSRQYNTSMTKRF